MWREMSYIYIFYSVLDVLMYYKLYLNDFKLKR